MNYIAQVRPLFDTIPAELQALNAWTLWKYDGQGKKPPCTTTGGNQHGPVATWELSTFDQVTEAYLFGNFDGVGLVLQGQRNAQGLYLAALDFDDLTTPERRATALRIANEAGCTYVEASPSGQGLRGWGWVGSDVGNKSKLERYGLRFEAATSNKYFTVTGRPLPERSTVGTMAGFEALAGRGGAEVGAYIHKDPITQQKIDDLRSPLAYLAAQGHGQHDSEWAHVRECLQGGRELDGGKWESQLRGLWLEYSRALEGYDTEGAQREAEAKWRARGGDKAHPNGIFMLAQGLGWVNPRRGTSGDDATDWVMPTVVDWANVLTNPPPPTPHAWATCTPLGEVTLLGAHGGTGKSMFALQLALHVAAGLPFMGLPVRQGRAVFFSGEDGTDRLMRRLGNICKELALDPVELSRLITVLDATDSPTLYAAHDRATGKLTPIYQHLTELVRRDRPVLVVIDNASDTFDASEIDRARVREFVRALKKLSPCTSVVLAVHLSKGSVTAKGSDRNAEDYSGSTAWHNSARSRLSLNANDSKTVLTLTHQKSNDGPLQAAVTMRFGATGVLTQHIDPAHIGLTPAQIDDANRQTLLGMIEAAFGQGDFVNPNKGGNCRDAYKVLSGKPGYPVGLGRRECLRLVDDLEKSGDLMQDEYTKDNRRRGVRFIVVPRAGVDPFDE